MNSPDGCIFTDQIPPCFQLQSMYIRYYILDLTPESELDIHNLFSSIGIPAEQVGAAKSVAQAKKDLKTLRPDLFFLNPGLKQDDGFQILKFQKDLNRSTIVVSSIKDHAVMAFSFSVADFLLMPIQLEDFRRALRKIIIPTMFSRKLESLFLRVSGGKRQINSNQIIRLQSFRNYTNIYLNDGVVELDSHNLGHFEKQLKHYGFIRIHHSHVVAINHVAAFHYKESTMLLSDGTIVPVSREKKKNFLELFEAEK